MVGLTEVTALAANFPCFDVAWAKVRVSSLDSHLCSSRALCHMRPASPRSLDLALTGDKTWFYPDDHNPVAIRESRPNIFLSVPTHKMLLAELHAVMASERVSEGQEMFQEEMRAKGVGRTDAMRNLKGRSSRRGSLGGYQKYRVKLQQESPRAGADASDAAESQLCWRDRTGLDEERIR